MKDDFLKECLEEVRAKARATVPLDEFQNEFCRVCQNRSCSRSGGAAMSFDRRVESWERRLFIDIPRASESDASYDNIRSKRFLPPVKSAWVVVPENLDKPSVRPWAEPPVKPAHHSKSKESAENTEECISSAVPEPHAPEAQHEPVVEQKAPEIPSSAGNVPFDSEWTDTGSNQPGDVVIQPGGSFTFGGGR